MDCPFIKKLCRGHRYKEFLINSLHKLVRRRRNNKKALGKKALLFDFLLPTA